ncbi:hypothetical protein [Methyloterricola oryzae]|uniref:hypothetical protein n=1 Tax=Methyloterricola oryzae TaxID=1495050 RepID=UPI0005EB0D4C|nr:hypothetical protein [Methyloterricola oryzae]
MFDLSEDGYRIVIHSIGTAGARMVGVLKKVLPYAESKLAALLFQAPAEIMAGLTLEQADEINALLRSTGLDSQVMGADEPFTPGDGSHEVALAIMDASQMTLVAQVVMDVLGVSLDQARTLLCASPTVLVGKVSANTVDALRRRFAPLGVELDVSRPAEARYDVFLGACDARGRERVIQLLRDLRVPTLPDAGDGQEQPVLAVGLSKAEADALWDPLRRTDVPLRLVNRDFERFDVRLEEADATPALADFLVSEVGMPAAVVPKVLARLPIVIAQNVPYERMAQLLAGVAAVGGRASGHLLAFQTFGLVVTKAGQVTAAAQLLQALGRVSPEEALAALPPASKPVGTMTDPQVRWLQHELKRAGAESRVVLR